MEKLGRGSLTPSNKEETLMKTLMRALKQMLEFLSKLHPKDHSISFETFGDRIPTLSLLSEFMATLTAHIPRRDSKG